MDITEIVRREYKDITEAKLVNEMVQIVVEGRTILYAMRDGKLYMYKEEEVGDRDDIHFNKFEKIYRASKRGKNIELLTDEN